MIRSAMPSLRFIFHSLLPDSIDGSDESGGASSFPFSENPFLASESPQRGFMQMDAPTLENVSLASTNLAACFYPENTGLVDFVAKYFSLSDQRQLICDERPEPISSLTNQQLFIEHATCQKTVTGNRRQVTRRNLF